MPNKRNFDLSPLKGQKMDFLRKLSDLGLIDAGFQAHLRNDFSDELLESLHGAVTDGDPSHYFDVWKLILDEDFRAPAWLLMLVVDGFREYPYATSFRMKQISVGHQRKFRFAKTLAEAVHRQADALYNEARKFLVQGEVDRAVHLFIHALAEFRFALESNELSNESSRRAAGMYAAAVALTGKWISLPDDLLFRALDFSKKSAILGNSGSESLRYRFEILLQIFDSTSEPSYLDECLELVKEHHTNNPDLSDLYAETFMRRSILLGSDDRNLRLAERFIESHTGSDPLTQTRLACLSVIINRMKTGQFDLPATGIALPNGLATEISQNPNELRHDLLRDLVRELEDLAHRSTSLSPLFMSVNLLRSNTALPSGTSSQQLRDIYYECAGRLRLKLPYDRHFKIEWALASLQSSHFNRDQMQVREELKRMASLDPRWAMPHIAMAKFQERLNSDATEIERTWQKAAQLSLTSQNLRRASMGGRSVFEVSDARGIVSDLFVFKPTTEDNAVQERDNILALSQVIERNQHDLRDFGLSRSLAILPNPDPSEPYNSVIHVLQRQRGRTLEHMVGDDAIRFVPKAVELLALFHNAAGPPTSNSTGWQPVKKKLNHWLKTFGGPELTTTLRADFESTFPTNAPLVKKRDGHAGNWLALTDGRIAAIDLESREYVPLCLDLAQLTEDHMLIPPNDEGWEFRLKLLERYISRLSITVDNNLAENSFAWFVLFRALFLATKETVSKSDAKHARQICEMIATHNEEQRQLASHLLSVLSNLEHVGTFETVTSRRRITLSKALSKALRHGLNENSVMPEVDGFIPVSDLAVELGIDESTLVSVAKHPAEPRFEIDGDRIRARYGHSLNVNIDRSRQSGAQTLFHGTSWDSLQQIVEQGLLPMSRSHVHLSTDRMDAIETGSRHGRPVLFSVRVTESDECFLAAEGTWLISKVPPERLSIEVYSRELGILGD